MRILPVLGAIVAVGAASVSLPASAAGGIYYRAELANPAPTGKFVARGIIWACDGTNCGAGRGTSRPMIICAGLAREAGEVKSFVANGKPLEADELARCNAVK